MLKGHGRSDTYRSRRMTRTSRTDLAHTRQGFVLLMLPKLPLFRCLCVDPAEGYPKSKSQNNRLSQTRCLKMSEMSEDG